MNQVYPASKNTFLLAFLLTIAGNSLAQISINSSDMPSVNDTFRLTQPQSFPGQFNYDLDQTGADYVWDFTDFIPDISNVDTFFSPLATPIAYNFVFTNLILYPDNFANLAQRSQTLPQQPGGGGGGGITFSDAYDFIAKSSSEYAIVGNAFSLNGVPSPNAYDGDDVVYEFPLTYLDQFSSASHYEIHISGLVDYYHRQTRTNEVDGWGMVYTPYGGFAAIRVKSVIESTDSIILSQIPFPFTLPETIIEYKWLAKNIGVPVLQINAREGGGGNQMISDIHYLDSLPHGKFHYSGTTVSEYQESKFDIFPNPAADIIFVRLPGNIRPNTEAIISEISGKEIFRIKLESFPGKINLSALVPGIYLIEIDHQIGKIVKM